MADFDSLFDDMEVDNISKNDDLFDDILDDFDTDLDVGVESKQEDAELVAQEIDESEFSDSETSFEKEIAAEIDQNDEDVSHFGGDEFDKLKIEYVAAKADYYRAVLRKEDENLIKRIQKIPTNWKNTTPSNLKIDENQKQRLSDLKQKKSWEMKIESLNIYYITNVEQVLICCFSHRPYDEFEVSEAKDSIVHLQMEVEADIKNFQKLFLSLTRRGISDLYYLILASYKFYRKRNFNLKTDLTDLSRTWTGLIKVYENFHLSIDSFIYQNSLVMPFFTSSSNASGWKLNEFAIKSFFEENSSVREDENDTIDQLLNAVKKAFLFRKKLKQDYDFLRYYYNGKDGKLYRYNFVLDLLHKKHLAGQLKNNAYEKFKGIRDNFLMMKDYLEGHGLYSFGPSNFNYLQIVEFIYKGAKVVESYYLRTSQYETLRNLRSEIIHYIEVEMESIRSSKI